MILLLRQFLAVALCLALSTPASSIANGNTTTSNGTGYAYDFENRLIQQGGISIVYDGDGNRRSKTVAGVTTTYVVADENPTGYAQVLEEDDSTGAVRQYTYALDLLSRWDTATGKSIYYVKDGHGSVRALADQTGAITDTYDYDAFGNLIHSTGSTPNNYLFAGEQFDPDLNLYYNRARYLNTSTGRFWTTDTDNSDQEHELTPVALHKYLYANAQPINVNDPSGNFGIEDAIVGVLVSLTVAAISTNIEKPELVNKIVSGCGPGGYQDCSSDQSAKILAEAKKWEGTPYLYGGDSRSGIDCSHLVYEAINAAGISFGYSPTAGLATHPSLRSISMKDMRAGDVLLFPGHVGFYDANPPKPGKTLYSAWSKGVRSGNPDSFGEFVAFRVRVQCPKQ